MRTEFVLDPDDAVAQEYCQKMQASSGGKGDALSVGGLLFQVLPFGPTFTFFGRTDKLPALIGRCRFTQVIIKDDGGTDTPARGTYRRGRGRGFVKATKPEYWSLEISHDTLRAVNQLYDDIRAGKLTPHSEHVS